MCLLKANFHLKKVLVPMVYKNYLLFPCSKCEYMVLYKRDVPVQL